MGDFRLIVTIHNAGPHTIWSKLTEKLGREPTRAEAKAEVLRILEDASCAAGIEARERRSQPAWKRRHSLPSHPRTLR